MPEKYKSNLYKIAVSEDELIEGLLHNDNRTINRLYLEVFPKVRAYILKNSGNPHQAKDVFQEAFIDCWRNVKLDRFDRSNSNIQGYLYTIAINKWKDFLRSSAFKKTMNYSEFTFLQLVQDNEEENESTLYKKMQVSLGSAFEKMGASCKKLLIKFYYDKLSIDVIAKESGLTSASARNKKYRCMEKLRKLVFNSFNE